ncbi:class I SAM-dependent methyltransferase [Planosporangium thailandense]|uniref:Class I SAM-dependent methyltransferase n=1 Tax=Planosporangium thailandense TaxID=765197 RepID=A0ABX0Y668_9ACTN|nr:class I SAM-dependent methyltransferase [Planosporangium thailandense]NJC73906.1 class I SAM-dependent methyltransferase [Planosporangium thailandense]
MDSAAWDARYASAPDLVWTGEPNRFAVEELAALPPGRALDLAAGEGRNAVWLAGRGWEVTAVDFSPVAVDKGRRLADARGVRVEWVTADLLGYAPPAAAFDAVLVAYLHLPAPDRAAVLARAAGALAPGGVLVVIGHDLTNLTDGIGGPQDPAILLSPEAVVATLPGLRIGRAERARRPVTTEDGRCVDAIDTVVTAVRD